jgi:glucose dehydrogenase
MFNSLVAHSCDGWLDLTWLDATKIGNSYTLDRANGSFVKGGQYVNDLNWTKGLDPKTGKPLEYDPKLDVQAYLPEARPAARRSD